MADHIDHPRIVVERVDYAARLRVQVALVAHVAHQFQVVRPSLKEIEIGQSDVRRILFQSDVEVSALVGVACYEVFVVVP